MIGAIQKMSRNAADLPKPQNVSTVVTIAITKVKANAGLRPKRCVNRLNV